MSQEQSCTGEGLGDRTRPLLHPQKPAEHTAVRLCFQNLQVPCLSAHGLCVPRLCWFKKKNRPEFCVNTNTKSIQGSLGAVAA